MVVAASACGGKWGDETLNAMNPPGDGPGERISVEMYEVAVDVTV